MTEYVILRLQDDTTDPGQWQQFAGHVNASSPQRALRISNLGEGTYVAVPVRSFKTMTLKVEQTTKVTIG